MALVAALSAVVLVGTALDRSLPAWQCALLASWLAAATAHALRPGRLDGARLTRRGEEWYLVGGTLPDTGGTSTDGTHDVLHDALTLHAPRYRSSWLLVLDFRDADGRSRGVELWSDAVPPTDFSYLHLACLFDAAPHRPRPPRPGTDVAR